MSASSRNVNIEKPDFEGMVKEHVPYTVIPNYVLQNFTKDPLALAIWCHLISLPPDWKVNRGYLMNTFETGRDKINAALTYLSDNFLISYDWKRRADGTVEKVQIVVKNGTDYLEKVIHRQKSASSHLDAKIKKSEKKLLINQQTSSTTLKSSRVDSIHYTENPLTGKTATTKEKKTISKEKREPARKKRAPLPDDFIFEERVILKLRETSKRVGLPEADLLAKFKALVKDKGWRSEDWNAAFERFLITEKPNAPFKSIYESKPYQEVRCAVLEWGPGHPSWDALHAH